MSNSSTNLEGNDNHLRTQLLQDLSERMKENEQFLHTHTKDTYDEIIELINDAIDYVRSLDQDTWSRQCMSYFLLHVLMPQSYALRVDVVSGNLPVCFTELRMMVEGLAVSFYADREYPECTFFQEKYDKLKTATRRETFIVKKVGALIEEAQGEFEDLWRNLSNEWVHTKGRVDRIVSYVSQHQDVPPWGLLIPLPYTESDISDLKTLEEDIAKLRKFVMAAMRKDFSHTEKSSS